MHRSTRRDRNGQHAADAPLRIRSVLADSFRIWRRDIRSLTVLAAGLEAPLVVAEVALHITPGLQNLTDDSFRLTGVAFVVIIYGSLSHHFLAGLLERVVAAERKGHNRPSLGEILRDLPWRRLLVADLLLTAIVGAGLIAFVVPGLIALTWFSVSLPIVNLERNAVLPSFLRSYHLVRGHSWRVFAIATCAFIIPELIIGTIAGIARHFTDNVALSAISHAVPAIALMPIAAVPIVVLAFDLIDLDTKPQNARRT